MALTRTSSWILAAVAVSSVGLSGCKVMKTKMMGYVGGQVTVASSNPETPSTTYAILSSASDGPTVSGVKYVNLEEFQKAATAFEEAVTANPEDANAQFLAGLAFEMMGELERAREFYDQAYQLRNEMAYSESYVRVKKAQAIAQGGAEISIITDTDTDTDTDTEDDSTEEGIFTLDESSEN